MSWDDWVFGIATGGLYNLGKAGYNALNDAGDAAEDAGDAAESAGVAIASIGATVEALGKQIESLLQETEELITINRLTPRDEADLWDEERERLNDLREREAELRAELAELENDDSGNWFDNIFGDMFEKFNILSSLSIVRSEIHKILYQEPGIIPTGLYNLNEVLERFNTMEQPRIEEILDSVNDNLEESEDVLKEVKKLFVERKRVPVIASEIKPTYLKIIEGLELKTNNIKNLIDKHGKLSLQLTQAMDKIERKDLVITENSIGIKDAKAAAGVNIAVLDNFRHIGAFEMEAVKARSVQPTVGKTIASKATDDTVMMRKNVVDEKVSVAKEGTRLKADVSAASAARVSSNMGAATSVKPAMQAALQPALMMAKKPRFSAIAMQPAGFKISSTLNSKFDGYQRNYAMADARVNFYNRELTRVGKKIDRIKFKDVDEPGVIPKTLADVHLAVERFRTEEQPRIETILDSVNDNLTESKEALANVKDLVGSLQGTFEFISKNAGMIKIGAAVFGGVIFLNLLMGLIVLTRAAFGI